MAPSAVSASRCWGCQPVRAVAESEASKAYRKSYEINGLYENATESDSDRFTSSDSSLRASAAPGLAQASHAAASRSAMAGMTRRRRSAGFCGGMQGLAVDYGRKPSKIIWSA